MAKGRRGGFPGGNRFGGGGGNLNQLMKQAQKCRKKWPRRRRK